MIRSRAVGLQAFIGLLLSLPGLGVAQSTPKPRPVHGFRLFARAEMKLDANRVSCGLAITLEVCVAGNGSSIDGATWPKNSPQLYMFNSGLQVAGKIGVTATDWAWAGDTAGGFFYDMKGTTQHGQGVAGTWNYSDPADRAVWPAVARVPAGDAAASFFGTSLQGRATASEQDAWFLAWEGDPNLSAGRPHPLGIAVETRALVWNYPSGNQDILYFLHTFYNISSSCPADYAGVRPELRDTLLALGERFQALNLTKSGVTIPACGYNINDLYIGQMSDPDVSSDAGNNYMSVNLPMGMSFAWEHRFRGPEGSYALPGELGAPPFTNGYGFVGMKFLNSPAVGGPEGGIVLASNFSSGGVFGSPQNIYQLYRFLTGNINPGLGDGACNFNPAVDRICYIKNDAVADMRGMQSTGPVDLAPGGSVNLAMAYIFASAVASPGCPAAGCVGSPVPFAEVKAGDPRLLANAAALSTTGANLVDSMAGFRGFVDDGDGVVQGREFITVRGSLMQKAQLAQAVFDGGLVLPSAPEAPEFFVVPGDARVSIYWRPSTTEQTGDLFYSSSVEPWSPTSPMYDPNYRQFDLQGYRIYRGRTDDPARLTLLAQFDHDQKDTQGHSLGFRDYLGVVSPGSKCAPELGLRTLADGCPVNFDAPAPGAAYTVFHEVFPDWTPFVQVKLGERHLMANGDVYVTRADTAITGGVSGLPPLERSGVPFSYVDATAINDARYYYTVTAFDLNSIQSGPSSMESPRLLKVATPMHASSNYTNTAVVAEGIFGRGKNMTEAIPTAPRIDGVTGVFNGPARPATGASLGLIGDFPNALVTASGEISITLDSMLAGSAYDIPNGFSTFWVSITTAEGTTQSSYTVQQDQFNGSVSKSQNIDGGPVDPAQVARYGGTGEVHLYAVADLEYAGNYYTMAFGRGCTNAAPGFTSGRCSYNGARWFDGANESYPHPTRGNLNNNAAPPAMSPTNRTNAGSLTGVANVYEARAYQTRPNVYRNVEGVLGAAATAADYKLYWGAAGTVDSVVDITHNVVVPFDTTMKHGYTWGFLTQGATSGAPSGDTRTGVLSVTDLGCIAPIQTFTSSNTHLACPGTTHYQFVNTVSFGPLAYGNGVSGATGDGLVTPTTNGGFGIYLAGHFFLMEMNSPSPTPPAKGTVWTMRSYVGAISGGGGTVGAAGNYGSYSFVAQHSPLTAVGAKVAYTYEVTNTVHQTTESDLDRAHTVPDPFYVTNGFATGDRNFGIKFVSLPNQAIVRIYTLSGVLVRVLEHNSVELGGSLDWDIRNRDGRLVAPGVYFYAIESPSGARRVGRMTIVNFLE